VPDAAFGQFGETTTTDVARVIENFYLKTKSNLNLINSISKSQSILPLAASSSTSTSSTATTLSENVLKIFEAINSDVLYLSQIDSSLAVACDIMKQFIDCYLVVKRLESSQSSSYSYSSSSGGSSSKSGDKGDYVKLIQIEEALLNIIKLIVLYRGYSGRERVILLKMYLYLRALYLREFYLRKTSLNTNHNLSYNFNTYLVSLVCLFFFM
jgi:hypothetical protein